MKTTTITIGIIAALLLGVYNLANVKVVNVPVPVDSNPNFVNVGAATGPDVPYRTFFASGLTSGGRVATTSTATTYTTDVKDFAGTPSTILWTPNINTTVSLSSTSTFPYVPRVGDVANVYLLNASSTAGSSITFAAKDANLDLQFAEATGGDLVLNGLDWTKLTIIRQTALKVSIIFDEMTEAD